MVIQNELNIKFPNVKFIFPQAPTRRVNIDAGSTAPDFGKGKEMPSWFDIQWKWDEIKDPLELKEFERLAKFNNEELKQSIKKLNKIIEQEIKNGVPANRIIIMGFSQGGALTVAMALASRYKLGGFVVLSGWLPNREQMFRKAEKHNHLNQETPVLFCHGDQDEWVPYWLGKKHCEFFEEKKYNVEFVSYISFNHEIKSEQIYKVNQFLENVLNPQSQQSNVEFLIKIG